MRSPKTSCLPSIWACFSSIWVCVVPIFSETSAIWTVVSESCPAMASYSEEILSSSSWACS